MESGDEIFKGKSLNDIFKDIYDNSKKKDRQIKMLIGQLHPLIQNVGDATVIVPVIKEYLDMSIKNDDQLVKMAAIVHRLISSQQRASAVGGDNFLISEEEKEQLLADLEDVADNVVPKKKEPKEQMEKQIDDIKSSIQDNIEKEDADELKSDEDEF
jgi:hypothetical protein